MAKSSCSMSSPARVLLISSWEAQSKIWPSLRMVFGLRLLRKHPTVSLFLTYERRVRLRRPRRWRLVDRSTAFDGTTLASIWLLQDPVALPSRSTPSPQSRGRMSSALVFLLQLLSGDQKRRL